jgi:hypothetical protein
VKGFDPLNGKAAFEGATARSRRDGFCKLGSWPDFLGLGRISSNNPMNGVAIAEARDQETNERPCASAKSPIHTDTTIQPIVIRGIGIYIASHLPPTVTLSSINCSSFAKNTILR